MNCKAEYHYRTPMPNEIGFLPCYAFGILTDEHAASSYGLPVFVVEGNSRLVGQLAEGTAFGAGDLPGRLMLSNGAENRDEDGQKDRAPLWSYKFS
jgi:hypothetical protein